jgi:hypothetical protein
MASDELLHAIGEITVEASYLEYCVAVLVNHANGNSEEGVGKMLSHVGAPLRELQKLREKVEAEQANWLQFCDSLAELEKDLLKALDERNKLVHSVEVLELSSSDLFIEEKSWHPKTGTSERSPM